MTWIAFNSDQSINYVRTYVRTYVQFFVIRWRNILVAVENDLSTRLNMKVRAYIALFIALARIIFVDQHIGGRGWKSRWAFAATYWFQKIYTTAFESHVACMFLYWQSLQVPLDKAQQTQLCQEVVLDLLLVEVGVSSFFSFRLPPIQLYPIPWNSGARI